MFITGRHLVDIKHRPRQHVAGSMLTSASPDHVVSSVGIAGPKDDPAVGCAGCVDDSSNPVKIGGIVHQGSEDPQIGGSKHPPNGGVKNRSKNTPKRDI